MSDYLERLIDRTLGHAEPMRPRPLALFEPVSRHAVVPPPHPDDLSVDVVATTRAMSRSHPSGQEPSPASAALPWPFEEETAMEAALPPAVPPFVPSILDPPHRREVAADEADRPAAPSRTRPRTIDAPHGVRPVRSLLPSPAPAAREPERAPVPAGTPPARADLSPPITHPPPVSRTQRTDVVPPASPRPATVVERVARDKIGEPAPIVELRSPDPPPYSPGRPRRASARFRFPATPTAEVLRPAPAIREHPARPVDMMAGWDAKPAIPRVPLPPTPTVTPTITVTIGRLEVRASLPAAGPPRRESAQPAVMSLDDYLRQRAGGSTP